MWRAKRTVGLQCGGPLEQPRHRTNPCDAQRLLFIERRQQPRQLTGQPGFAAAGWPNQQQVMPTGGCNRQGPCPLALQCNGLALLRLRPLTGTRLGRSCLCWRAAPRLALLQLIHKLGQTRDRPDRQSPNQGGFGGIGVRHHQGRCPVGSGAGGDGQRAPDRAQLSVQAQFSGTPQAIELGAIQLPTRREQAQGDRQIEGWSLFSQVRGGQVDHDPHQWAAKAAVAQSGAHPFTGFLNRFVRQPHQLHPGKSRGEIHFHGDRLGVEADEGRTETTCQHCLDG